MSWSRRATLAPLLGLTLAAVAGCGFTPVYAPDGAGTALRGRVLVDAPTNPRSYALVRRLEQRLGQPESPVYRLSPGLSLARASVGITPQAEITRYNIAGSATWTLARLSDGAPVASGEVESFTSYSATRTTIATRAAEQDAYERLMTILADRLVAQMIAATAAGG